MTKAAASKHTCRDAIPHDLARKIGAIPDLAGTGNEPLPGTMLDWALRWGRRQLRLFPCKSFLGSPITPKWYAEATFQIPRLVEWWSETPDADIAAVPELSGHFVIAATGKQGRKSLGVLQNQYGALLPTFTTETRWGDLHLWFEGRALTSRELLGPGLHVIGPGRFVYMPASLAPDPE